MFLILTLTRLVLRVLHRLERESSMTAAFLLLFSQTHSYR